jgi:hypothetical protein
MTLTLNEKKLLVILLGRLNEHLVRQAFHVDQLEKADLNDAYYALVKSLGEVEEDIALYRAVRANWHALYKKLKEEVDR